MFDMREVGLVFCVSNFIVAKHPTLSTDNSARDEI